jgi:NAD(P)-dependent dehydrogenase (short-subunit alcohol dehydrogenase family)
MSDPWPSGPAFAGPAARREALSGRVAVVTGASRGLGAGLAAHFAQAGLRLGLCARHRPDLVTKTRPRAHDGRIEGAEPPLVAPVDVVDFDALADFAAAVIQRFGRIDLWVNNAGLLEPIGPVVEADPAEVARHVAVNVTGVLYGTMIFAGHVRGRTGGGVLVNVSSGAGSRPYSGWAAYCGSKAAVDRLTEAVALEEAGHGLRAHAVAPGLVDTDMQAAIRATDESRFPEVARFRQLKRDGAFNSPPWVAEHLLQLAFGQHSTGQVRLRVPNEPHPSAGRRPSGAGAGGGPPSRGR